MCSAPNVYMFVYILIGTHMVPLSVRVGRYWNTDVPFKLVNISTVQES